MNSEILDLLVNRIVRKFNSSEITNYKNSLEKLQEELDNISNISDEDQVNSQE